jgi:hypothetical protein
MRQRYERGRLVGVSIGQEAPNRRHRARAQIDLIAKIQRFAMSGETIQQDHAE